MCGGQVERVLVGATRVAEPALGGAEVAQRDRAAQHVSDVARALQALHGDRVAAVRRLQVAGRPGGQPRQGAGGSHREVVTGRGRRDRPVGMDHGAGRVACDQRECRTVGLHRTRQPGQLGLVEHDQVRGRVGQQPLHVVEPTRNGGQVTARHQGTDQPDGEHRPAPHHVVRKLVDPAPGDGLPPLAEQADDRALDQIGGVLDVAGVEGVPDRRHRLAGRVVPPGRPPVQRHDLLGPLLAQVAAEHVGEQVVVAVPLPAVVQAYDEQVRAVQQLQHRPPVARTGDRIAQGSAEPVQDRGLQQEAAYGVGLATEHLLDQVVHDEPVVAREAGDEAGWVVTALERQRRELQRGDPPLGPAFQGGDVGGVEVEPDDVVEVGRHLVVGEAEVGGADLDQLATGPEPGEREVGVGPRADHQVHLRRQVLEQERHVVRDLRTVGEVVVVEHEHQPVGQSAELVEDDREHGRDRRVRRVQERQRGGAHARRREVQRGHDVGPEGVGPLLALLERDPCDRAVGGGRFQPGRQQRGLAEPRRRGDQGQPRWRCPAEPLGQPRSRHEVTSYPRDEELGAEQVGRHDRSPHCLHRPSGH